ncbi:MAG: putative Ig domain-containing protein [Candidatus Acidoferrales bacterium]
MKRLTHSRWMAAAASTGMLLTLAACVGSGGGNTFNPPPPAPPPLSISTTSLPDGNLNQSYSATLQASGGTGARTWSIPPDDLPDGLNLNASTGTISGTPTAEGTFNFTVQVADSGSPQQVATRALSILIRTDALTITTTSLLGGQVGVAYSQFVSATNGQQPFSWSISAPALPTGLSIDTNTGEIGGPPTTANTFNFTVQVTDDLGDTATAALSIVIDPPPPLAITTTALPDGAVGIPYNITLQGTGGTPPLTWSVPPADLPPGLALDPSTGTISGSPTGTGTFPFTVNVVDSGSPQDSDTQALSITILSALSGRNDTIQTATPLSNITA